MADYMGNHRFVSRDKWPHHTGCLRIEVERGHGEILLSVDVKGKGWLRNIFRKKERLPLFGGRGYQGQEGHELIGVVTWRT
jgi:hypothetical protein